MLEDDFTITVPDFIERSISAPPMGYGSFEVRISLTTFVLMIFID
jgi:hypothetical protein